MKEHYLLGEVSKNLGRKPHQIVHLLTSGKMPNRSEDLQQTTIRSRTDIDRLARHFRVTPKWAVMESTPDGGEDNALRAWFSNHPTRCSRSARLVTRSGTAMARYLPGHQIVEGHCWWRGCWRRRLGAERQP